MSEIIPVLPLVGKISSSVELTGHLTPTGGFVISGEISSDVLAAKKYDGPYEVAPRKVAQTLATSDKYMVHDLEIDPINYSETTNPSGGVTVNIGYE